MGNLFRSQSTSGACCYKRSPRSSNVMCSSFRSSVCQHYAPKLIQSVLLGVLKGSLRGCTHTHTSHNQLKNQDLHSFIFKACENISNIPIIIITMITNPTRAECEGVPLLCRHQNLPPHCATGAVGVVLSLRHPHTILEDPGEVAVIILPVPSMMIKRGTGHHAEADVPGPSHGHGEDACNKTNVKKIRE